MTYLTTKLSDYATQAQADAKLAAAIPDDGVWKRASNINGTYYKSVLWYRYLWNNTYLQLRGTLDCSTGGSGPNHEVCKITEPVLPESSQWWIAATNGTGFVQVGLKATGVVEVVSSATSLNPSAVYVPGVLIPVLGNGKASGGPRSAMDIPDEAEEDVEVVEEISKDNFRPAPVDGDLSSRVEELEGKVDALGSNVFAKANDPAQSIAAKTVLAETFAFNPQTVLKWMDMGDGPRLVTAVAQGQSLKQEQVAYKSDLTSLDGYAKTDWVADWTETTKVGLEQKIKTVEDSINALNPVGAASAGVDINDPALATFKASVLEEVRKLLSGGKTLPADIGWTPCIKVNGSGLIEARLLNGVIQLRGELVYTYTSTGTFGAVQKLPAGFPSPTAETVVPIFCWEAQVAYRRGYCRLLPDGGIQVVGDGKVTHWSLTGVQAYAY